MSDPVELIGTTIGGAAVGGIIIGLVKGLGTRSVNALDETLKKLAASIDELGRDIRTLRETDIAQAKDIGALQQAVHGIEKRVDGQSAHYREQLDAHRQAIFDRLAETVESIAKGKKR